MSTAAADSIVYIYLTCRKLDVIIIIIIIMMTQFSDSQTNSKNTSLFFFLFGFLSVNNCEIAFVFSVENLFECTKPVKYLLCASLAGDIMKLSLTNAVHSMHPVNLTMSKVHHRALYHIACMYVYVRVRDI